MKAVITFLLLFQFQAFAQCDTSTEVVFPAEIDAQFPGGISAMKRFIQDNLEYPKITGHSCHQFSGRVYLQFIVCDDGSIQNIELMRPSNSEFDQIAIDLIKKMPNWIPAEENGQAVTSKVRLPITICPQ